MQVYITFLLTSNAFFSKQAKNSAVNTNWLVWCICSKFSGKCYYSIIVGMYQYLGILSFCFLVWTDTCPGMPIFRFFIINILVCTQMWQKWYIPRRIMPNTLCKNLKFIWATVQVRFTAEILEFSTWRTQGTQNFLSFYFIFFKNSLIYCVPFHKSKYIQAVLKKLKIYIYYTTTTELFQLRRVWVGGGGTKNENPYKWNYSD